MLSFGRMQMVVKIAKKRYALSPHCWQLAELVYKQTFTGSASLQHESCLKIQIKFFFKEILPIFI